MTTNIFAVWIEKLKEIKRGLSARIESLKWSDVLSWRTLSFEMVSFGGCGRLELFSFLPAKNWALSSICIVAHCSCWTLRTSLHLT